MNNKDNELEAQIEQAIADFNANDSILNRLQEHMEEALQGYIKDSDEVHKALMRISITVNAELDSKD